MIRKLTPQEIFSLTRRASESFFADSKIDGIFDFEGYCERMAQLISLDIGVHIAYLNEHEALGIIGATISKEMFTGDLVCIEMFWYVLPEYRTGPAGIKLIRALEQEAEQRKCARMYVGNLACLNPHGVADLYVRMGYKELETHYVKTL